MDQNWRKRKIFLFKTVYFNGKGEFLVKQLWINWQVLFWHMMYITGRESVVLNRVYVVTINSHILVSNQVAGILMYICMNWKWYFIRKWCIFQCIILRTVAKSNYIFEGRKVTWTFYLFQTKQSDDFPGLSNLHINIFRVRCRTTHVNI